MLELVHRRRRHNNNLIINNNAVEVLAIHNVMEWYLRWDNTDLQM
jgi:hypothetical protein